MMKTFSSLIIFLSLMASCGKKLEDSKKENNSVVVGTQKSTTLISDQENLYSAIKSNDVFFVKHALRTLNDLQFQFKTSGETPLTEAIKSSDLDIVVEVLRHGEIQDLENKFFETPVNLIIKSSRLDRYEKRDLIRELIDKNINLNKKGLNGSTALKTAIEEGEEDIALMLIINGANTNQKHNNDISLLETSKSSKLDGVTSLLEKIEKRPSPISENISKAIGDADLEMLNYYFQKDPNLNLVIDESDLLIEALKIDKKKTRAKVLTYLLLTIKASTEGNITSELTPLMFASKQSKSSHKDSVSLLIRLGADVYRKDNNNLTALDYAASNLNHKSLERIYNKVVSLNPDNYLTPGSQASRIIISACYNVPRKKAADRVVRNGRSLRKKILYKMRCPN